MWYNILCYHVNDRTGENIKNIHKIIHSISQWAVFTVTGNNKKNMTTLSSRLCPVLRQIKMASRKSGLASSKKKIKLGGGGITIIIVSMKLIILCRIYNSQDSVLNPNWNTHA